MLGHMSDTYRVKAAWKHFWSRPPAQRVVALSFVALIVTAPATELLCEEVAAWWADHPMTGQVVAAALFLGLAVFLVDELLASRRQVRTASVGRIAIAELLREALEAQFSIQAEVSLAEPPLTKGWLDVLRAKLVDPEEHASLEKKLADESGRLARAVQSWAVMADDDLVASILDELADARDLLWRARQQMLPADSIDDEAVEAVTDLISEFHRKLTDTTTRAHAVYEKLTGQQIAIGFEAR